MRHRTWILCLLAVLLVFGYHREAPAQGPGMGISWGFARTFWDGTWNEDGYPDAGTGAVFLSLRRVTAFSMMTEVSIYLNYMWSRHTTTTLVDYPYTDPAWPVTRTDRTYYREIDVGFNLHRYFDKEHRNFYIGVGPQVRWGQAGRREVDEDRPGDIRKGAWFGLTFLLGYTTQWEKTRAFIEPQFILSPDNSDRWQENYPPETLVIQMGLIW